jgi:ABC-type branched-subunit amino acid transport system substrate-binding protein
MKYLKYLLIVIFVSNFSVSVEAESPKDPREIRLGTLTGLSGYSATQGTDCRNAMEAAGKHHAGALLKKGYTLKFFYGDSQGAARPALTEYARLVNLEQVIGIGLDRSSVGMAVNPLSERQKIPVFGVVGHHQFISENEYAFRVWPATSREGEALAKKIIADGIKKLAVITTEDDWNLSLKRGFLDSIKGSEVEIVYDEDVNPTETEFSAYITKIRAAKPDAIFLNLVIGQPGIALKKIAELAAGTPVYASFFAGRQDELDIAKEAAEGMILADVDYDVDAFKDLLTQNGYPDTAPNGVVFNCHNAVNVIAAALLEADKPVVIGEDLYQAALKVKSIEPLGRVMEIKDRELQFSFVYRKIKDGKAVTIK